MVNNALARVAVTAAILAAPIAAGAAADDAAFAACSKTFMDQVEAAHGPLDFRVAAPEMGLPDMHVFSLYRGDRVTYTLTATRNSTGSVIATMDCTATSRGKVIETTAVPAPAAARVAGNQS